MITTIEELATALRSAADAHHEYEDELGRPDKDWATWYAGHIVGQHPELLEQTPGLVITKPNGVPQAAWGVR